MIYGVYTSNMANGILSRLYGAFKTFNQVVDTILRRGFPSGNKKDILILYLHLGIIYNSEVRYLCPLLSLTSSKYCKFKLFIIIENC